MEQPLLDLRPKYPPNPFRYRSQNWLTYDYLVHHGRATGIELAEIEGHKIMSHTRRFSDLREYLNPKGWDLKSERVSNNPVIYEYWIEKIGIPSARAA